MPRQPTLDSYTGEPYEPEYVSPLKGINAPRNLFKVHRYGRVGTLVQWEAIRVPGTDREWTIKRLARDWTHNSEGREVIEETTQERRFEGSETEVRRMLDWCIITDRRFIRAWRTFLETGVAEWLLDWSEAAETYVKGRA